MPKHPDIDATVQRADKAFDSFRKAPSSRVQKLLNKIAEGLEDRKEELVPVVVEETNLPTARIEGELKRTTGQLRMFADIIEKEDWLDVRIDGPTASYMIPLGPVAVFGASNFPLAFSTIGGDSVSALASKCPVVYKLHPAHPKTTYITTEVIKAVLEEMHLDPGIFQIVEGDIDLAHALVGHPHIKAVGFTGSQIAGKSLLSTVKLREEPIPFYAEMSSINPIFIFPEALMHKAESIAQGLSDSVTLGTGQFCTNPGLVFIAGDPTTANNFLGALTEAISKVPTRKMLTDGIMNNYMTHVDRFAASTTLNQEYRTQSSPSVGAGPAVFSLDFSEFMSDPIYYQQEVFGPSTVVVKCTSVQQFSQAAAVMEGQLTASFHAINSDCDKAVDVIDIMSLHVGRLVWNGFPTGVLVNHAMQHGGPWPCSSDSRFTSVGTRAILRWVRPLCYQDFPVNMLPSELKQ